MTEVNRDNRGQVVVSISGLCDQCFEVECVCVQEPVRRPTHCICGRAAAPDTGVCDDCRFDAHIDYTAYSGVTKACIERQRFVRERLGWTRV